MTDRPIIFSAPMVRALLNGTKTQTRRILKPDAERLIARVGGWTEKEWKRGLAENGKGANLEWTPCQPPRFRVGDRLWVRETWAVGNIYDGMKPSDINPDGEPNWCGIRYKATDHRLGIHDRPSIYMPRWASRLTLIVTDVRVERLQDISEEDAIAEGSREPALVPIIGACWSERDAYAKLWNHINGPEAWELNPWVVAVSSGVHQSNIDQLVLTQEAA